MADNPKQSTNFLLGEIYSDVKAIRENQEKVIKRQATDSERITVLENFKIKAIAYTTAASAVLVYLPKYILSFVGILIK